MEFKWSSYAEEYFAVFSGCEQDINHLMLLSGFKFTFSDGSRTEASFCFPLVLNLLSESKLACDKNRVSVPLQKLCDNPIV